MSLIKTMYKLTKKNILLWYIYEVILFVIMNPSKGTIISYNVTRSVITFNKNYTNQRDGQHSSIIFPTITTGYFDEARTQKSDTIQQSDRYSINNTDTTQAGANAITERRNDIFSVVNEKASIIFGGDVSFDAPIRYGNTSACNYSDILANLSKYFRESDFNMINLEAPLVTQEIESTNKLLGIKGILNKAWSEAIVGLTENGIKGVTLANNHINDYGENGVEYTMHLLNQSHIDIVGLSRGKIPPYIPQRPLIKDIKGIRIGFLAYCSGNEATCGIFREGQEIGPALLEMKAIKDDVKALRNVKPPIDFIFMYLHWGREYMAIPNENQRIFVVELSKLGVDVVIGSHPHVLQGHEWINETLVKYSLGNLVFHPHSTFMGELKGKGNRKLIHERAINQSRFSRGPAGLTELFKIVLTKKRIERAEFLPIRIHVDNTTRCLYPKVRYGKALWEEVCGPEDDNCYYPREV